MVSYINSLKQRVLTASEYNPQKNTYNESDLEAPTRVMTDPGKAGDSLLML